ncbi:unnamed protein product, partial [marine sediment metagenome]
MSKLWDSVTNIFKEEHEGFIMLMDIIYPVNKSN